MQPKVQQRVSWIGRIVTLCILHGTYDGCLKSLLGMLMLSTEVSWDAFPVVAAGVFVQRGSSKSLIKTSWRRLITKNMNNEANVQDGSGWVLLS